MNNDELRQYTEFYKSQKESIERNSAELLNRYRDAALKVLEGSKLPKTGSESYHVSDLKAVLAPDYGINCNRLGIPVDTALAFKCDVPNLAALLYFQCNDEFRASDKNSHAMIPEGVIIDSLRHAAEAHKNLVAKYYAQIAPAEEIMVALNTMLAQDGVLVYIPKGTVLSRPVQIVNILSSIVPLMVNRRVVIVAESGAEAKFVFCDHTQNAEVEFLSNQVVEVYAGENAKVEIYDMEESGERTHRVSSTYVRQMRNSKVLINSITLMNGTTRNNVGIDVSEEGCETHLYGICIGREKEIIDNNTFIGHNAPNCQSREQYKYLLEGKSKGCFGGKIFVSPGADKVEAYQSNNNIISSAEAKMYTKPQLEIYTDDVKCSHGATTGQLDQNALFYMRTRGIPEEEAKSLLMQAFMDEVIATVNIDILRDRLKHLVEKRLKGTLALCSECGIKCTKKE